MEKETKDRLICQSDEHVVKPPYLPPRVSIFEIDNIASGIEYIQESDRGAGAGGGLTS